MAELNQGRRTTQWVGPLVGIVLLLAMLVGICIAAREVWIALRLRPHGPTRFSEAKTNLKAAFQAEKSYFSENDRYDESTETVGFWPESGNRYRYVFSKSGDSRSAFDPDDGGFHVSILADTLKHPTANNAVLLSAIPAALLNTVGVEGTCPTCNITIVAAGNIDDDPTIDVWSIATKERTINGEQVLPGVPFRHVNDSED